MRSSTMLDVRSFRRGLFLAAICVATILGVGSSISRAGDFHLLTSSSDEAPIIRGADPESRPSFLLLAQAELPTFDDQPSAPVKTAPAGEPSAAPVEPQIESSVPEPASPASSQTQPRPSADRSASTSSSSSTASSSATKADFSLLSPQKRFEIAAEASRPYRILLFTDPNCGQPCKTQESILPEFIRNGWLVGEQPIAHLQIVRGGEKASAEVKSLFSKFLVESTPTLILISRDREIARRVGLKASADGYGRRIYTAWTPVDLGDWMRANVETTRRSSAQAPAN